MNGFFGRREFEKERETNEGNASNNEKGLFLNEIDNEGPEQSPDAESPIIELKPGVEIILSEGIEYAQIHKNVDLNTGHTHKQHEGSPPNIIIRPIEKDASHSENKGRVAQNVMELKPPLPKLRKEWTSYRSNSPAHE